MHCIVRRARHSRSSSRAASAIDSSEAADEKVTSRNRLWWVHFSHRLRNLIGFGGHLHQLRRHRRSGDPKNAGVLHLPTSKPSVPQSSQSVSKSEDRLGRADLIWIWNRLELKIKSRSALFVKSTHWSVYPGTTSGPPTPGFGTPDISCSA